LSIVKSDPDTEYKRLITLLLCWLFVIVKKYRHY
jgi:hypothetical protein